MSSRTRRRRRISCGTLPVAGDPLVEVQHGLAFARKARFDLVIDIITQLGLVRTLHGLMPTFGWTSFSPAAAKPSISRLLPSVPEESEAVFARGGGQR
jgi:hypothetical protein